MNTACCSLFTTTVAVIFLLHRRCEALQTQTRRLRNEQTCVCARVHVCVLGGWGGLRVRNTDGGTREKIERRITHPVRTSLPSRKGVIIALERRTVDVNEEDGDERGGGVGVGGGGGALWIRGRFNPPRPSLHIHAGSRVS